MTELVLPFVLRLERSNPPTHTDALEAAAAGVLHALTFHAWADPDAAARVARWDGQRIRKVVRRARGAHWRRAEALDGITVRRGSAEVRVFAPVPVDGWPPDLARLQVAGTDLEDPLPPTAPAPGTPLVLLCPHVQMTTGKAMAQAAHAAQLGWRAAGAGARIAWQGTGFAVAVRTATARQWALVLRQELPVVQDAGFTEVVPGTCTAAFVPPGNPALA